MKIFGSQWKGFAVCFGYISMYPFTSQWFTPTSLFLSGLSLVLAVMCLRKHKKLMKQL